MKFYILENLGFVSSYAYGEEVESTKYGDAERCSKCNGAISMLKWLPPYEVILEKPKYGDFVYGSFTEMLVSEKFMEAYKKADLTGITSFHPVDVVKIRRQTRLSKKPPDYYKVEVIRTTSLIDEELSDFKRGYNNKQTFCEVCRIGGIIKSFRGIYVIEASWTGEDIFYATGLPGDIIVTSKFVDFVQNNKFKNVNFINAEEYWPISAGGPPPKL